MSLKVTDTRKPQTGRGKKEKKICPECGEYYLMPLCSREVVDGKVKNVKRFLFCDGCKHIEPI